MYQSGQIYYIRNFKQGESSLPKNRYCVILTIREVDFAVIIHKITKKPYCDPTILKQRGNKVDAEMDIFYFPKDVIVGKNGFAFEFDSYIHMGVWNISEFTLETFSNFDADFVDDMIDEWLNDLIYFIYKSDHIKQKYVPVLEPVLEKLNG